jgi:hypothetical protein
LPASGEHVRSPPFPDAQVITALAESSSAESGYDHMLFNVFKGAILDSA